MKPPFASETEFADEVMELVNPDRCGRLGPVVVLEYLLSSAASIAVMADVPLEIIHEIVSRYTATAERALVSALEARLKREEN